MDDLVRSVGNGIAGLVGGAVDAIGAALAGIGDALSRALPAGTLPVLALLGAVLLLWLVLKR